MSTQATTFLSPAEYLEQERQAERKSEYFQGEMFAMPGASPRHVSNRGRKFQHYRTLPSLAEYLTVAQNQPHIEHWTRQPENGWLLTEFGDPGQSIHLASIDFVLPLAEVYDKVEWTIGEAG